MQRKIDVLRERYSSASWAIWSAEYPDDGCAEEHPSDFYDFVHSNLDHLRPEIVLLSLNPSTDKPGKFLNFHSTNSKHNDNRLRRFVEQSGLDGAYMTDFVMDTIESDSKQVNHDRLDVLVFLNQLNHPLSLKSISRKIGRFYWNSQTADSFPRFRFDELCSDGSTGS